MILFHSVLVEVLMKKIAMLLPLVAVAHHTETPTSAHPAQRQRYTPESNSHTRTGTRPWYCDLSRNILMISSRRGRRQLQWNRPQMLGWSTTLRYTRSLKEPALEEQQRCPNVRGTVLFAPLLERLPWIILGRVKCISDQWQRSRAGRTRGLCFNFFDKELPCNELPDGL